LYPSKPSNTDGVGQLLAPLLRDFAWWLHGEGANSTSGAVLAGPPMKQRVLAAMHLIIWLLTLTATACCGIDLQRAPISLCTVSPEIRVSSDGGSCDYYQEDYRREYVDFDYPKVLVGTDNHVLVSYVDVKADRLYLVRETGSRFEALASLSPSSASNHPFYRWPFVWVQDGGVNVGVLKCSDIKAWRYHIAVYSLNLATGALDLRHESELTNRPRLRKGSSFFLSGLAPFGIDRFLVNAERR
jgi:hypothetical protein